MNPGKPLNKGFPGFQKWRRWNYDYAIAVAKNNVSGIAANCDSPSHHVALGIERFDPGVHNALPGSGSIKDRRS
jgi:hypothetical protein